MLGSSLVGGSSSSPSKNRVFVYEVAGLKQNEANDGNSYPFRSSSNVFVRVPYNRMNEEMQRIGKMGGTIVNIQSLDNFQKPSDVSNENADNSED
ncbi:CpcD/allophycocyanin linker domain protein [Hyella patelloides LEGE 07179]|uniref:CpcD/allophycocyanin linker domain protein n=1 Tax=Hyella patelloides LEGE 07179 TaxID=945734 RepID=A0A563VL29_9CYAN|nr:phycobilisome linker polypeptide [Hyella patelloides]VEP12139.1 CpcD/allophycocyanin linker domain protein [Hyella patelloides LEGE 07179]